MKKIAYKITGMNCNHCTAAVNKALANCPGVLNVQVSLDEEKADLEIDEAVFNIEEAKSAVSDAGYQIVL